jgi:glycosyltransferase involved in cell wall biosynthesis
VIVLHLSTVSWETISGPNFSVPRLVAAQNRLGDVCAGLVITRPNPGKQPENLEFSVFDYRNLLRGNGNLGLPVPFDRPDVCVFHSTYIPVHGRIAARLRRLGIPYVICPRGGMSQYAQAVKPLKKRLGNLLFFQRMVDGAVAVQCVSEGEAAITTQWNRPIFVAGNGVHLPPPSLVARPGSAATRRLLYLGRIDTEIKGLDLLVAACGAIRSELIESGAVIDLYGPDWTNSKSGLNRQIERLGLSDTVRIHDPVRGDAKAAVFAQHDAFLQTSRTEAHSLAALEALGAGLPCLLTRSGHMADEVADAGAGWAVETTAAGIATGLLRLLRIPVADLQQVGRNGRKLAAERFSWHRSATLSVEAYRKYLPQQPLLRRAA